MIPAAFGRGIPWDQLDDHALWLAAVVAGLTALGWLGRRVLRAARAVRGWALEARRRFEALERLVTHELQPNTGTSLKDQTSRIERRVRRVEARSLMVHGMLDQHVEESRGYVAAVRAGLADQGIEIPAPPRVVETANTPRAVLDVDDLEGLAPPADT